MSKIRGITIEFSADSSKLENALKDINKETRDTGKHLRDINKLLKFEPKNVELLTQKQVNLSRKIEETNEKLSTLHKLQADMDKNGVDKNSKQYEALRREIIDTESLLKTYKEQLKDVNSEIDRNTNFSKKLGESFKEVGNNLKNAGQKVKDIGKEVESFGKSLSLKVTAPIAGFGTLAVKNFAEAESAWAGYSRTSGIAGEKLTKIMDKAKESAKGTAYSSKEVAEMMEYMALAGWSGEESLSALDNMLQFVTASGLEAGHASDIVTDNLTAFGLQIDETDRLMNVMLKTQSATNTNTEQLAGAYSNAAATAGALGYSVEDTSIALGLLANAGLKGENAGTKLRSVMTSLTTATDSQKEVLNELGVEMYNADGSAKPLMETVEALRGKFENLTEEEKINFANKLVGKNNVNAFMIMMNASNEEVQNATNAIKNQDDALGQMNETMTNTTEYKLRELKTSFGEMTSQLGEQLVPILLEVVDKLKGWIEAFSNLDEGTKQTIVQVGLAVAAIGPIVLIIGKVISGIGALISIGGSLMTGIGTVIGVLGGPLTLAIGAVIAIGVALWKNWDTVKEAAGNLASWIGEKWENIKTWTSEKWNNVKETVSSSMKGAYNAVKEKAGQIGESISTTWNNVKSWTSEKWSNVKESVSTSISGAYNSVKTKASEIGSSISSNWNAAKTLTSNTWSSIKDSVSTHITSAWSTAKTKVSEIGSSMSSAWGSAKTLTSNTWGSIKDSVIGGVKGAWNGMTGWLSKIKNAFNFSWSIPMPKLPKISVTKKTGIFGIPYPSFSVSWNREGGIFKKPTILSSLQGFQGVGEPSTGGEAIMPLNKLPQLMAEAMEKTGAFNKPQVIKNVFMIDGKEVAHTVAPAVDRELGYRNRRNGVNYA